MMHDSGSEEDEEEEEEEEEEVLLLGVMRSCVRDIGGVLRFARESGLNFVATHLFHPRRRRAAVGLLECSSAVFSRSDLVLDARDWSKYVVGCMSDYIDLDSKSDAVRVNSEFTLREEFDYALYLGLNAVVLPLPARQPRAHQQHSNLARSVSSLLGLADIGGEAATSTMQVWLRVPFCDDSALAAFRLVRRMGSYSQRLGLCVDMRRAREGGSSVALRSAAARRWLCEPVRCLALHADLFECSSPLRNKKRKKECAAASLALLPEYEGYVLQLMALRGLHICVSGAGEGEACMPHLQALEALWARHRADAAAAVACSSSDERHYRAFVGRYRDSLRLPLQPLQNNLECNTYRVMEMDPVKYAKYAEAIALAMRDLATIKNSGRGGASAEILVIAIGAGRGFLADTARRAARELKVRARIVVIEKNKSAVITLRSRDWGGEVAVIHADARDVRTADLGAAFAAGADLLLSELLGSFGDNELSPDIIDGVAANGLLNKLHGVSIPSAYTSHVAPLYAPALHAAARQFFPGESGARALEQLYVVHMTHVDVLAPAKPLFCFHHSGSGGGNGDGNRYGSASFSASEIAASSATGGYVEVTGIHASFDCVLYKDIYFSTVPETHSVGMSSWFPGYLPLRSPLLVPAGGGGAVGVSVWRRVDKHRLWYEWSVAVCDAGGGGGAGELANANGRSYFVGK